MIREAEGGITLRTLVPRVGGDNSRGITSKQSTSTNAIGVDHAPNCQ